MHLTEADNTQGSLPIFLSVWGRGKEGGLHSPLGLPGANTLLTATTGRGGQVFAEVPALPSPGVAGGKKEKGRDGAPDTWQDEKGDCISN